MAMGQDGLPSQLDSKLISIVVTPTITSGSAYASGNALGSTLNLGGVTPLGAGPGSANPVRFKGGSAKLAAIVVSDKSGQNAPIDVVFFNQAPGTNQTDKTAVAVASADLINSAGSVSLLAADYISVGASKSLATKQFTSLAFSAANGVLSLYAQLVVRGTPTYTSTSDIQVTFVFERE